MDGELSDTSRQFLNRYFHMLCREPQAEELADFFRQQQVDVIPAFTQFETAQIHAEAGRLWLEHQRRCAERRHIFRHKILSFVLGIAAVTGLVLSSFHWLSIVALVLIFFYALHARRSYTHAQYIVLALEGLMQTLQDKFDIDCAEHADAERASPEEDR